MNEIQEIFDKVSKHLLMLHPRNWKDWLKGLARRFDLRFKQVL
jgi:hypothetical protein